MASVSSPTNLTSTNDSFGSSLVLGELGGELSSANLEEEFIPVPIAMKYWLVGIIYVAGRIPGESIAGFCLSQGAKGFALTLGATETLSDENRRAEVDYAILRAWLRAGRSPPKVETEYWMA